MGDDHQVYKDLNHLRKLRNKIHIYSIERELDTDWNNFSTKEYSLMKKSIKSIIDSSAFLNPQSEKNKIFNFLK